MIQTHTYPNGLRLVMENIPCVRSVSIGIWIGTGSKHETPQNNGIAHFTEHMLFKGTESRTARDIAEAFDKIGGHLNAFTSKEYTCYFAEVLDEHLPYAMEVLADMFFHSTFDEKEIAKEKNVVLEELNMCDDTPDELIHDLIAKATYNNHALGFSILGRQDVLQQLTADDLYAFMQAHYTSKNTVIAVAGHIREDQVVELVEQFFDEFPNQVQQFQQARPCVTKEHIFKAKDTEQSHICIGLKALHIGDAQLYALILLNNILGGSMSSRLFQKIREEQGMAYSVFSYLSSFQEVGSLHVYAGTSNQHLEDVYHSFMHILEDIADAGVTEKELRNSKEQLKGNLILNLESTYSRMVRMGKNELLLNEHLTVEDVIERINEITLTDIHQLAQKLFQQPHSLALISSLKQIPETMYRDNLLCS